MNPEERTMEQTIWYAVKDSDSYSSVRCKMTFSERTGEQETWVAPSLAHHIAGRIVRDHNNSFKEPPQVPPTAEPGQTKAGEQDILNAGLLSDFGTSPAPAGDKELLREAVIVAARNFVNKASYTRNMPDDNEQKGTGNYLTDAVNALDTAFGGPRE